MSCAGRSSLPASRLPVALAVVLLMVTVLLLILIVLEPRGALT